MVLKMYDGCISDGLILGFPPTEIPAWLRHPMVNHNQIRVFIRLQKWHFRAALIQPHALFEHDPARHTPMNVQMNIPMVGQFYTADSFQPYNVSQIENHSAYDLFPSNFPLGDNIFVAVPEDRVYIAALQHQPYARGIDRQSYLFPGISQLRRWLS